MYWGLHQLRQGSKFAAREAESNTLIAKTTVAIWLHHALSILAGQFKDHCFRTEKEWRVVIYNAPESRSSLDLEMATRPIGNAVASYYKLPIKPEAIASIVTGSKVDHARVVGSLQTFFKDEGNPFQSSEISFKTSIIPLR